MLVNDVKCGDYVYRIIRSKSKRIRRISRDIVEDDQCLSYEQPIIRLVGSGPIWPSCHYFDLFHTREELETYLSDNENCMTNKCFMNWKKWIEELKKFELSE